MEVLSKHMRNGVMGSLRQRVLFEHKITYLLLASVVVVFFSLMITREPQRNPLPQPNEPLIGLKVPFSADLRMINDPRAARFVAPTELPDQIIPLSETEAISAPIIVENPATGSSTPLLPLRPIVSQVIPGVTQLPRNTIDTITDPLPTILEPVENIVDDTVNLVPETVEQIQPTLDTVLAPVTSLLPAVDVNLDLGL